MGFAHMGTGNFGPSNLGLEAAGQGFHTEAHQGGDALETYFECITTCSLDDGACVTRCVEQLREQP